MIKREDGVILLNLQEQVQRNKEDIAAHYNIDRVLADFGIRVVGQVQSTDRLPDPDTYKGNYGDAYAVGGTEPYYFYVWTRADIDSGHPKDYWFNIGKIAIIGPEGPRGPQGLQGPAGRNIKVLPVPTLPTTITELNLLDLTLGDYALPADEPGQLYYLTGKKVNYTITEFKWNYVIKIIGPKGEPGQRGLDGKDGKPGEPGPKGERGDVGGFINIRGILEFQTQLPSPESLKDLSAAFLVGAANPRDLYVQIGENSDVAVWSNTGPFNAATLVMSGGEAQNVWDADTKLDKVVNATSSDQIYVAKTDGTQGTVDLTISPLKYTVPRRTDTGTIRTNSPVSEGDCVNKTYADNTYVKQATEKYIVHGTNGQGAETTVQYNQIPYGNGIAQRMSDGRIKANNPSEDNDCANKEYVDLLHMADDARLGALEDSVTDLDNQIADDRFVMTNVQNMTDEKKLQARNNIDVKAVVSTTKETVAIPEIVDIDTFRTYFYNLRKSEQRHYQFEISNGGMFYDMMSILGYPDGVRTATSLFLYVDMPYSEAGGFELDLTLMGRNSSEYYHRTMHSTLNSKWQDSGWYETATKEQLNSLSMAPSNTHDTGVFPKEIPANSAFTYKAPSNGYLFMLNVPNNSIYATIDQRRAANVPVGADATINMSASKDDTIILHNDSDKDGITYLSWFYHAKEV